MARKAEFFVSFFEDVERGFGFSYSDKNDFGESDFDNGVLIEKIEKEIQHAETGKKSLFATRFADFTDTMKGYIEFLRFFAGLGSFISESIAREALLNFLKTNGTAVSEKENLRIFRLPVERKADLLQIRDILKSSKIVGREIPQMLIMGIVSSYEHQLSLFARVIIELNPRIIVSKEKTVSLLEILEADSIESAKQRFIDKEVENIFREGPEKQIEWFETKVGIDNIRKGHKNIDRFLELFERRNLFAHNNGCVNGVYLSKVSKKYVRDNGIKKGDILRAGPKYFHEALDLIIEFGVKLMQVCWRKIAPDEQDLADSMLSTLTFELIQIGEYRLANYLLVFARSLRGKRTDIFNRIFIVNHANSCKLLGNEKEALEILDSVDWSASASNFQCCVAAVRGNVDETVKLLKKIGRDGEITALAYQEWPVFYHVRDHEAFRKGFKSVFGVDYIPSPKKEGGLVKTLGGVAFGLMSQEGDAILLRSNKRVGMKAVN
ncbi:hypothetical protein [Rhizobium sp. GCM10022189]|uniref:hypothetical protein n=1 Tax=Rhizobium sp. GCM10022189 TaxID=3252654 RepID=UPI00360FD7BA